jgi:hypothetical protein
MRWYIKLTGNKMKRKKESLDGSNISCSGESTQNSFSGDSTRNIDLPLIREIDGKATSNHITMQPHTVACQACTAPSLNGTALVPRLTPVAKTAYSICKINHAPNIQQGWWKGYKFRVINFWPIAVTDSVDWGKIYDLRLISYTKTGELFWTIGWCDGYTPLLN